METQIPKNFVKINARAELEKECRDNPQSAFLVQALNTQYQLVSFLREERHRAGLTQQEMVERTGMAQPAISRLEKLGNSPKVETLITYLQALDLDLVEALKFYSQHQRAMAQKETLK